MSFLKPEFDQVFLYRHYYNYIDCISFIEIME